MNYLDLIIAIPLLWGAFKGFKNGLILEAGSLAALALGVWGAIKFSGYTASLLNEHFTVDESWVEIIAFALTFIGIVIITHITIKLLDKLLKAVALGLPLRIAGTAFGIIKFGLIIGFFIVILDTLNNRLNFMDPVLLSDSLLYKPLLDIANVIRDYFAI